MEMEDAFKLAQSDTRFIRVRKNLLYTFGATRLPYVCISRSSEDGKVLVRQGEARAERPQIAVPGEHFAFEGFEDMFGQDEGGDGLAVFLARRISLPFSRYVNESGVKRTELGSMEAAIDQTLQRLDDDNDIRTAVIEAPEPVWGLSILLYIGSQVARSAQSNVSEHFERFRLRNDG